jgi:SAM-dependent methyltransferase
MTVTHAPSPELVFESITSYQKTAAFKAAIELDVFTAIGDGASTPAEIARKCGASERGIRILCDYLTVAGVLEKGSGGYRLTPDSAMFLSKRSPAYMGGMIGFLLAPEVTGNFDRLAETIRTGTMPQQVSTVAEANPIWIEFARAMASMAVPAGHAIASILQLPAQPFQILDIAAGHGMYGITVAQHHPQATVVAVDWPAVLEVATENASKAGLASRFRTIPGDAFKVDFGSGFGLALVTNFLHHFDRATCVEFLRKVAAALAPGGQIAVVEFVPNADRISPPIPAGFGLTMLAGTPSGDVYTEEDLHSMLAEAGLRGAQAHQLPTPQKVVVAKK